METAELKKTLIAKINETESNEILKNLLHWMDLQQDEKVYVLTDAQNTAIEEAREDYKNGRFLTDDDANAEIEKWLKK